MRGDIRIEHMPTAKPGRRWWVVRERATGSYEGAIPASDDFPNGSTYRTKAAAAKAAARWIARNR